MRVSSWQLAVSSRQSPSGGRFRITFFLLLTACCLLPTIQAQPESDFQETAPPPLKVFSKTERKQLEAEKDAKERTKLALELIEARLVKAETLYTAEQYQEMFTELGAFHALVDNALEFLNARNAGDSNKILYNFKRIELSLRKHITRLEIIRRDLPLKFEQYVRRLVKDIRDARSRAIEPLFDDTVLPDKKSG